MHTDKGHDYLRRLPAEHYKGQAYVHWSLTIQGRRQGWLRPIFYYKFRELLTHTSFRYGLTCPIFCCMPDHLHVLLIGIADDADQRIAMRYLRRRLNETLRAIGYTLQSQGFDHVLTDDERREKAFEAVVEYIARNPERAGLVEADRFGQYPYTNCLVPGYPELSPFTDDYWPRFWRTHRYLRENWRGTPPSDTPNSGESGYK